MLHLPIDFLDKLVTLGGAKTAQTNEFPTELGSHAGEDSKRDAEGNNFQTKKKLLIIFELL